MTWWEALLLGLVEGITEYLPVSSTGHLILAAALLGLDRADIKQSVDAFLIVVQGGAILAVLGLYWPRVLQILRGLVGRDPDGLRLGINLAIAFLPAGLLGPLLDDWLEANLFHVWPVLGALFLGGLWMIWLGRHTGERAEAAYEGSPGLDHIRWPTALGIGLFQCVAMWPGTSRSMMTIAGGVMLGLRPKDAAEFSFLLALPTLGGATVYKLAKNLKAAADTGTPNLFEQLGMVSVVIGLVAALVSAALAVKWLVAFLNRHGLAAFGWYRIGLAVVLGGMLLTGAMHLN